MTLDQLHYFIEVYKSKNISKAAELLLISQPSLSVSIKKLEKELGVTLFQRVNKQIVPTAAGDFFFQKLSPLLMKLDVLKKEMISIGANYNKLAIGIPPMIGSFMFAEIYGEFSRRYPEMHLNITETGTLKMIDYLLDETLDLSFMLKESINNKNIEFIDIVEKSFCLYVSKDHPLAGAKEVLISNLSKEPLILFNNEFVVSKMVKKQFGDYGMIPNIILETAQINTIHRFLSENLAVSILIDGSLKDDSSIVSIPINDLSSVTIGIARKSDFFLTNSAAKMIDFIKKKISGKL